LIILVGNDTIDVERMSPDQKKFYKAMIRNSLSSK